MVAVLEVAYAEQPMHRTGKKRRSVTGIARQAGSPFLVKTDKKNVGLIAKALAEKGECG
jgi:hypothetical protein